MSMCFAQQPRPGSLLPYGRGSASNRSRIRLVEFPGGKPPDEAACGPQSGDESPHSRSGAGHHAECRKEYHPQSQLWGTARALQEVADSYHSRRISAEIE
jgi:hypothetical protein